MALADDQRRQNTRSELALSPPLWLLAGFGFLHGTQEWLDMAPPAWPEPGRRPVGPLTQVLSYFCCSASAAARPLPACRWQPGYRLFGMGIYLPLLIIGD